MHEDGEEKNKVNQIYFESHSHDNNFDYDAEHVLNHS